MAARAKLDGWRVQVAVSKAGVQLYSRRGITITSRLARLRRALAALPVATVLDGELVSADGDFWNTSAAIGADTALIVAFDVLMVAGQDVRPLPLMDRKALLGPLVRDLEGVVAADTYDDGMRLLAALEDMGGEGVVSKRRDAPYRAGQTRTWLKCKTTVWREANRERWRAFVGKQ